jgi:HlyD family secretion protein
VQMTSLRCLIFGIFLLTLIFSGCSEPITVKTVKVDNHRLEVSFTERAETLLRHEFPISIPVNGRIHRVELEVGDRVREGETLAQLDVIPARQEVEARQAGVEISLARQRLTADTTVERAELSQANKRVQSILAESARVKPAISAATTALLNAEREKRRVENLVQNGALPQRDAENAQLAVDEAEARLAAQSAEEKVLQSRLAESKEAVASVRARLNRKLAEAESQSADIDQAQTRQDQAAYTLTKSRIVSPIDGLVLALFERGPKDLPAGAPLMSLGRLEDLEAECDVLSQDALRLSRGTPVFLDAGDAFPDPIRGEVRLKEPQGFTKRSSLGVEQQRVRVRIGLIDPPAGLGAGYELWARFQLQEKTTLSLPRSCFVRYGQDYRIWRVTKANRLELISVEIGLKGNDYWEVTGSAVKPGDDMVSNPNEKLSVGLEVKIEQKEGEP